MRAPIEGGTPDFAIDPAGLSGVAGKVGKVYDDADATSTAVYRASLSATAVGDADVAAACADFQRAWETESAVTVAALAEFVRKVSTAAQLYQETDLGSAADLRRSIL